MVLMAITTEHGECERRTPQCYGANANKEDAMRQQAKQTIYRVAPIVTLIITVAAPRKWS